MNFWQKLNKPIFALAPMEDVTNCAFREIFAKYGKPDLMFTEFVNVDGLTHAEGFKHLKIDLEYTENQRPIVAQIWGRDPQKFLEAAKIIAQLGFDGIDINMGCPQDKEISQKTCAALIREPELAGEIIQATIEGAKITNPHPGPLPEGEGEKHLPVSVKTRLGYSKTDEMEGWISHLLQYPIAALTIHARTKQEKSAVPAHWEKIKEAVEIRDRLQSDVIARSASDEAIRSSDRPEYSEGSINRLPRPSDAFGSRNDKTFIIGNGDIKSSEEAYRRIKETGCDGVMVARGAFGNPWMFRKDDYIPSTSEKLFVMAEHAELYEKMYKGVKSFVTMRKNFKAYASGFPGAHELRAKLMETQNAQETKKITEDF